MTYVKSQWSIRRMSLLGGMGIMIVVATAACGPLGSDDDEPTATSAAVEGPTTSASPVNSPTPGVPTGSPPASPVSAPLSATPALAGADSTPEPNAPSAGGATPDAAESPVATPEVEERPDASVDSCDPDAIPPFAGDDPNYVTITELNFREGPGQDCDRIGDGPLGEGRDLVVLSEPVTREGEDQEWVQVEVDGETGWVAAEFVEPAES